MLELIGYPKFTSFVEAKDGGNESLEQPHIISASPPMKLPMGLERIAEAFKKSKEVPVGKEVDSKAGGEKDVTMKGRKLYIVGGAVRDYLLGHTPHDYDICTDAHPDEVERIMLHTKPAIQVIKKDVKRGMVKVSCDGEQYEIETMRKDSKGGASKETGISGEGITFTADPAEDCERRDLTINCLYYEISAKKIYDYTGGLRHLKDGVVRFNGKAEDRLGEDGMRKYRYARMLNKVPGSKPDKEAQEAIGKMSDDDHSPEQVRDEFWRGMEDLHTDADKYLKTYHEMGLLKTVFPKLELSLEFPNCKTCKSRPVVLAALLKNNKPPKLVARLKELKYTDREIKDAVFLINLLLFKPEYAYDFKKELMNTGLTKRQMLDWAKINHLNIDLIEKLLKYKFSVNAQDIVDQEGLQGEDLKNRVRHLEMKAFMRS